ncbi:PREDICTED: mediator of RNA polymerase II transcription subunit 13 isoform X2 [Rhagoletis zephyria]|uniref:mediator of RNA polymerase II transcription subunit 13 isoform X2 n=1 Tax=Rhagoletis zephyria TaxID=28612 RepID=UPI0008115D1B|nr:PREDICTED: mediator of RNA polymerase II transcription subunit 13 isoform X2 [Rhagoletis zephyria]
MHLFQFQTDLCGIKWRKFVNGERVNASSDPLDDPILRSYSRCMQADILCVWRRIQSTKQEHSDPNALFEISSSKVHPPLSLAAAKELWIFWYGEEPDLGELVDAELLKVAANQALWNGTWERGLTYECRSLLFKALHNLMERFVLTKDIVRFGKWFVQPCTSNDRLFGRSSQHLSFSFTFFVHGDTVCASIDLREHPAVRPLTKEHLTEAGAAFAAATNSQTLTQPHEHGNATNLPDDVVSPHNPNNGGNGDGVTNSNSPNTSSMPKPRRVILAPFGMAATLTGNSFKATDPMAEKILEDWTSFFPLCNKENSDVPPVVEVVSGGHKMYHPSMYVLVTDLDDMEEMEAAASQKDSLGTTSSAEAAALAAISAANSNEFAGGGSRKPTSLNPGGLQQQQQQQQQPFHAVTTITTTTVATSSSHCDDSNSVGDSNSSLAMVEQRLHDLTARTQPFYDTAPGSFIGSTTNTHASPQAATEMPERVWQDCVTNTLHVAYAASVATSVVGTSVAAGAAGYNISSSSHTTTTGGNTATSSGSVGGDDCNSTSGGNNRNIDNSMGSGGTSSSSVETQSSNANTSDVKDVKDINGMEMKMRMQQLQFWGFVDPMEKAPCTCTKTLNPASMTPHDTPHGGASTYSRNSVGDLMPVPSVGSPGTPAQSPHPNSTLSQPTSVPPADQLMTMSPRAPPSVSNLQQPSTPIDHLLDKNTPAPTPTDQHDNKSITTSPYVRPMPSVEPPPSVEGGNGGMGGLGPNGPGSVPQPPSVGRNTPTISSQQQHQQQHQGPQAQILGSSAETAVPQCGSITIKKFELQQTSLPLFSSEQVKTEPDYGSTSMAGACTRNGLPMVSAASGISAADAINDYWKSFKMPEIKVKDIDSFANDDCSKFDVLYDFTFQNAWANHPMKRFKLNEAAKPCRSMCTKNLYEGHTHSKPLMPSPGSLYGSQLLSIDASVNPLGGTTMDATSMGGVVSGGLVGIAAHGANMANANGSSTTIDGNSSASGYFQSLDIQATDALQGTASPCKEGKSSASGNLYTAEGLNPTMNDLEQLFETSNDDCGSVQIHTPPDSNNPSNGTASTTTIDDLKRSTAVAVAVAAGAVAIAALQNCSNTTNVTNSLINSSSNNGGGTGGPSMIQAEDLTKMFPTPPSHEQHHPNSSPCQMDIQMTDLSVITASTTMSANLETGMGSIIKVKQEYSVELGSPVEEPIEDWSYVYRPPKRAKFVGSSKYAPLTNLPSQMLPLLSLPSNCTYKPSWTTQKSRAVVAAQAAAAQQQQQLQQQQLQQQHQQQQQQQQQNAPESTDMKPDIKADAKPPIVLSDPLGMGETMEDVNPPAIVLYIVEPFTFGSDSPELERLACIALLRCYAELLKSIPDSVRANMNIQMISLESIVELGRSRSRKRFSDEIRCLALNIFSQCRRHLVHTQAVKSLTGFGTAANMEAFLKSKEDKNRQPYKMYTPPYVLAPMHEKNDKTDFSRQSASMRALNEQKYSVMYCNYCLSEDQSWLLATVTDDRGEMFEKIIINIDVPNRTRRRKAPARRVGLKKLMDFIMGLISQTAHPWRLVVGRIGRIGHSELKSWSSLLSKQNLQKASKQLKDICKQCSLMYPPGILSACLVTLEPDSKLRVMPDQFTPDERFSQISMQNPLSTPQDVTCTHILVFPTSAVCLSFTRQFQNEPQVDLENDFLNFDEEDENEGFTDADLMGDLLDWDPQPGRMSNHCSPDRLEDNRSWQSAGGNNFNSAQQQDVEEVGSINQQPLAVGYMVSTAPTGRMPSWFWSACPHLEDVCPVFLKTALHLHVPNIQTTDDILNSTNAHSSATDHPLDSSLTADVLRFVLEGYNALSWLALDSNTHDRLSCLPINVQMLMDLYYLTAAIM